MAIGSESILYNAMENEHMRIDTFEGQEKRLLFWEDGDCSKAVKTYMLKHKVTGVVFFKMVRVSRQ